MVQTLFQTAVKVSLTTSAVIAVLLLLLPLIHKTYTAKWRYFVWLILAVRLLIPFSPSPAQTPIEITPAAQHIEFKVPVQKSKALSPQVTRKVGQQMEEPSTAPAAASASRTVTLQEILYLTWLSGIVLFLCYHLIGYFVFKKSVLRFSRPIRQGHIAELWEEVRGEMAIRRGIELCVCKKVQSPMITGFFRPFLLLPDSDYHDAELRIILKHELIHYRRRDIWYKLLLVCANAAHWFNPIIYLMRAVSNRDIEMACDSELIKDSDPTFKKQYSEIILSAIHRGNQCKTAFSTYFFGGEHTMKERFLNILDGTKKRRGIAALCVIMLVTGAAGASVAYGADNSREETAIDNIALLSAGNSYSLSGGAFVLSYGAGTSAVVPLAPDTDDPSAYFADKAVYQSDSVTAIAYGDSSTPASPVAVLISKDEGQTWNRYTVSDTKAEDYGQKYLGFTTPNDGWLLLAGDAAMGHQEDRIFQTADGGKTWCELDNLNDIPDDVVTGAGFTNQNTGFVSFRSGSDVSPVVYRTEDGGKTWTPCALDIPESFKSITTYATAQSPVFNGAKGVFPVTLRNNGFDSSSDPVDVTVWYETSDSGKTWTLNEKYNLALIWADAWKTRDGRARYEVMSRNLQADFRAQQEAQGNYVIRWSSPWVTKYTATLDGDQAILTYWYTDSTASTYKGVERLSFGTENGRTVVTGCRTEADMEEYVDTSGWQSVDTGLYTLSIPGAWNAQISTDETVVFIRAANGEQLGTLSILAYDSSAPLSQFEGNHAETLSTKVLEGCPYPATKVIIRRTQPAAAMDDSYVDELHIYLIPKSSRYAYDLCFDSSLVHQKAEEIARSLVIREDRVALNEQILSIGYQWAEAVRNRDGKAQYDLMSSALQKKVYEDEQERHWVTGQSSPWVDSYSVKPGDHTAVVTYTYMTSEGFAGFYEQTLTFAQTNGGFVISDFTEPEQPGGRNNGVVIRYLEDQKTYLSANRSENGMFFDMTLSIDGRIKSFSWETCSKMAFLPELSYADVDGDGKDELIVILCEGEGSGTLVDEIHVINPEDFSEITVQNPLTALENRVVSKIDETGVGITIDSKNTLSFSKEELTNAVAEQERWFTKLGLGAWIDYSIAGNYITVDIGAQLSPAGFLGSYHLVYVYKDNHLSVNNISFSRGW